jgi:diaminohydroxyphosphoribosylaminopyrimidine deaminase / 5-amino-6-(5-phosphoribosylamino)uracil reductase
MPADDEYMAQALDLALSFPFTSPNPRVGALVVRGGDIIGAGVHRGPGTPHAETVALDGIDASGATLYVNLEPCMHQARTPHCAPEVVSAGIERVVAATEDPDERVRGRGFEYLRAHGVEVTTGALADRAKTINDAYMHHRATGRPLLRLKLALTLDGRLAAGDGSSRWITGPEARAEVHESRAQAGAVLVGAGTIAADDPELTARDVATPRQPVRVIVDTTGRTPPSARAFHTGEIIVATTARCPHEATVAWKEEGAEVLVVPERDGAVDLRMLLESLGRRGITEVYCEGGARIATSLLAHDLVDRLELHYGPAMVGSGPAVGEIGVASMSGARRWRPLSVRRAGDDVLMSLVRQEPF